MAGAASNSHTMAAAKHLRSDNLVDKFKNLILFLHKIRLLLS